ncbi:hypothetical protein KY362_04225 [Candidatus Woesearchaeota archaeon]|nr:hypothetical protein [Candidatus Woesearchaeota archaeon]
MSTKSTTIRIDRSTKDRLEQLDFVRKHTFDEILIRLMDHYEKRSVRKR